MSGKRDSAATTAAASGQELVDAWGAVAPGWERRAALFREATRELSERLVALLDPQPGETLLELAAGIGETGFLAAQRLGPDGRLISTDAAPEMLAAAHRRAEELGVENAEFREIDAERIDLADGSVDGVLCRFGIMLLPDPGRALAEVGRVLRSGGRAAIAVWASADANDWMTAPGRAALELGLVERPDPAAPGPFRLADLDELRALVSAAGLRVTALEEVPVSWRAASAEEWWATTLDMSPSLSVLLAQVTSESADAIRRNAEERLAQYVTPDGSLEVPGVARALLAVRDLEDRFPEGARHEFYGDQRGRVLAVEDRVHLDDLERAGDPRLGHELEREVRLAVGEPAAQWRPYARCDLGIENVEVERDVDETRAGNTVECFVERSLDPDPVDLAHGEDPDLGVAEERLLGGVECARADDGHTALLDGG